MSGIVRGGLDVPGAGGKSSSWNLNLSRRGMMTDTGCTPSSQSLRSLVTSQDITSQLPVGTDRTRLQIFPMCMQVSEMHVFTFQRSLVRVRSSKGCAIQECGNCALSCASSCPTKSTHCEFTLKEPSIVRLTPNQMDASMP